MRALENEKNSIHQHIAYGTYRSVLWILFIWGGAIGASFLLVGLIFTALIERTSPREINTILFDGKLRSGVQGGSEFQSIEGIAITSYGENGTIVDKPIVPSLQTVAFLGDSYVKARHVADEAKFTELVEKQWNATYPDNPLQTVNISREGADLRAYLIASSNIKEIYDPIRIFVIVNDRDFTPIANNAALQTQVKDGEFTTLLKDERPLSTIEELVNQSGLAAYLLRLQKQSQEFMTASSNLFIPQSFPSDITTQAASPMKMNAEFALQLEALQSVWGEALVIVHHQNISQWRKGDYNIDESPVVLEADRLGIDLINLTPEFIETYANGNIPKGFNNSVLGEGHWNELGHQVVSDAITAYLSEQIEGATP